MKEFFSFVFSFYPYMDVVPDGISEHKFQMMTSCISIWFFSSCCIYECEFWAHHWGRVLKEQKKADTKGSGSEENVENRDR